MNEAETEVMWAWHDQVHEGPYRFCQENPCLSLRKLYPKGDLPTEYRGAAVPASRTKAEEYH